MAERRMFAKTIIDSDAFLDMPQSTQLLYFHLSMRADDDGFINNPKSITRNVKCNEDDLKLLALKKFIIPFESGIVVIKHWKIHNYIRNDRYKETKYKEEKSQLILDDNNSYRLGIPNDNQMTTIGIPTDNQMDTQVRIVKDIDIKESNTKVLPKKNEHINYQKIVDEYNNTCVSLSKVKKINNDRKKAINARLKMYSYDEIIEVFEKAEASDFLKGSSESNFKADFDWLMKDRNMAKVLEGKYDNRKVVEKVTEKTKKTNKFNNFSQRNYSREELDELEKKLLSK